MSTSGSKEVSGLLVRSSYRVEIICQLLAKQKYCSAENTVALSEMMRMWLVVEYFHNRQTLTEEMIDIWM
jgi:hypothetical protein